MSEKKSTVKKESEKKDRSRKAAAKTTRRSGDGSSRSGRPVIQELPLITLQEMTLFPGLSLQFDLEKKSSIRAVEAAMTTDQRIFLVNQNSDSEQVRTVEEIAVIGTIAQVQQVLRAGNGLMRIQVLGMERAAVRDFAADAAPYLVGSVQQVREVAEKDPKRAESLRRGIVEAYQSYCMEFHAGDPRLLLQIRKHKEVGSLADKVAANLPMQESEKRKLLEELDEGARAEALLAMIEREMNIARERRSLSERISQQIDEHQREYMLREQLSYIQSELAGEGEEASEAEQYRKAAESLQASQEVKDKLAREIRHLELSGYGNPESSSLRSYIETLLELPWDKTTAAPREAINVGRAREILDRDHYGLQDVKERILEYLAVRSLTQNQKGDAPILCLVGPPGTGKTSIARSIAEATGKPYVRICLGGVRDEAEIRGHRKTYVGAMPGRITEGLKQAGVRDPLMLLDEIDKMSQDYRGDTASAMLEVLDSEQNRNFRDHYLELPQDLSEVLFLATANDESTIPRPLLDRMEIIEIAGYTANEKYHIAKEHLLKKVYEKNGIPAGRLVVSDGAIRRIIECYCREAGVRQLERELDRLCRKAAVALLSEGTLGRGGKRAAARAAAGRSAERARSTGGRVRVTERNLEEYLGKLKFPKETLTGRSEVGLVRGLAWTAVGGDTLQIEVQTLPGKGELELTGQLGDVMKESAIAAITYVRSISGRYGIKADYYQKHDIHIHIPEGAVPKDGPSAGITMATAVLSAVTRQRVRKTLAMTGEISLRGRVMPVGGLKEKLLAANTLGIQTVLVPAENRRDIEEIQEKDSEITEGLTLVYVKHMDEVVREAFPEGRQGRRTAR